MVEEPGEDVPLLFVFIDVHHAGKHEFSLYSRSKIAGGKTSRHYQFLPWSRWLP
jgi:hypothetical protein